MATNSTVKPAAALKRRHRELLASARLGVREAQYELGLMYASGSDVKQDFKAAVAWVTLAAERGLAAAQYLLATQYAAGAVAGKEDLVAHAWLNKAADQGHPKAILRLARMQEASHPRLAIAMCAKAAEAGLAEAQLALGLAHASGRGVAQDLAVAARWFRLAAERGLAAAQHELGDAFAEGRGVEQDLEQAHRWYRAAAAQDHAPSVVALDALDARGIGRGAATPGTAAMSDPTGPVARASSPSERRRDPRRWLQVADPIEPDPRYRLGQMFEHGIGTPRDVARAQSWYALAARQGDARAQSSLGRLLEQTDPRAALASYAEAAAQGDRDAQVALARLYSSDTDDPRQAFAGMLWYARAAESGEPLAQLTLGHLMSRAQEHIAYDCFRRAAEQGVAQAQFMLAQSYETGCGVPRSESLAAEWYQRAADQGHAQAQCALGLCHLQGRGVAQSALLASEWLQRAAAQGDAKAQWQLGALHASGGEGVERDLRAAFTACRQAAEQGFVAAQATLGTLHVCMEQPEQAVAQLTAAAEAGDAEASYNLGLLLAKGQGCVRDARSAFRWFIQAATQGITPAQSRVGILYATGDGVAPDPIEAHKWFVVAARAGDSAARANRKQSESQLNPAQIEEAERRAEGCATPLQTAIGLSKTA